MELIVTQLYRKNSGTVIVPQTTSEAVLVKHSNVITTLDKVLDTKIENIITPVNSDLKAYKQGQNIILAHSNNIEPNNIPQNVKIQYDSHGHISNTIPIGKITITVNDVEYLTNDSPQDQDIKFGENFDIDTDEKIQLKWMKL